MLLEWGQAGVLVKARSCQMELVCHLECYAQEHTDTHSDTLYIDVQMSMFVPYHTIPDQTQPNQNVLHTYIHTYIHTYMHTYIDMHTQKAAHSMHCTERDMNPQL